MFRKLAESFQGETFQAGTFQAGTFQGDNHTQYMANQNTYFNTLPNMILSGTSGLKGFDTAIQSVDSMGKKYENTPVKNPNNIFIQESSSDLNKMAQTCAASSIDQLIAMKNPNASIGCGFLYTPPNQGSPYPTIAQGFIGDENGPLQNFQPPDYKKYLFDLQLAKKQMLLDKCKALKACTDVDSEVFNGTCGYCTDTNQGVPIDTVGQPLYGGDSLGTCNPQSIITSGNQCPLPPGIGSGPQPMIDKTCDPVNGRLSSACLYSQVLAGGCSNNGTLAIALANPSNPTDYIGNITNGDSVKIYNRVANPPLKLDIFRQGITTVSEVLKEVRQLAGNTKLPSDTATGAAARDLCLQKGAISGYNFCQDIPDTTSPPFDMGCLQQLFRKMGGQPTGTAYPNQTTMTKYNTMNNLGVVKQFLNGLIQGMSSSDYEVQRAAMTQFLGISPEKLISRAPYTQGVEVIWMLARPGYPNQIWGILKRTIENDIVQFGPNTTSPIPQLASVYPGFTQYGAMIQMFDLRATNNFTTKFQVTVDDGFFVAVNQPANIAQTVLKTNGTDDIGLFSSLMLQSGPTYVSKNCSNYNAITPNITKLFFTDAGGGAHTFQIAPLVCNGTMSFSLPQYSLIQEPRAPFLSFEVLPSGNTFDDIRNPGLFSSLLSQISLEYHIRSEERKGVPGGKSFVRLTNTLSSVNISNVAYQAWGSVTFAIRLQSMPIRDSLISFFVNNKYCVLYLKPINGSIAQMRYTTNITANGATVDTATNFNLQVGIWYYIGVAQSIQGFDIYCDSVANIVKNGNYSIGPVKLMSSEPITTTANYGLYQQGMYSCNIQVGGAITGSFTNTASFQFDLAWVHFFDYYIGAADIIKDCKSRWQVTEFPESANTYRTF